MSNSARLHTFAVWVHVFFNLLLLLLSVNFGGDIGGVYAVLICEYVYITGGLVDFLCFG
jgi:hypothetical protein